MSLAHHPLKMARLPISPPGLILSKHGGEIYSASVAEPTELIWDGKSIKYSEFANINSPINPGDIQQQKVFFTGTFEKQTTKLRGLRL